MEDTLADHLNEMDNQHRRLNAALQQVLPDSIVYEIVTGVRSSLDGLESKQAEISVKLEAANKQTSDFRQLLANSDAVFRPHLAWWHTAHAAVPVALWPAGLGDGIDDLAYIEAAVASHQRWADARHNSGLLRTEQTSDQRLGEAAPRC
jgi:hypothetical protein